MIRLNAEVMNLDTGETREITFPCDFYAEFNDNHDCIVTSCQPSIPISRNDELERLNDILDDINSENPGMTEDYLEILSEAYPSGDLFDEEFTRKLRENDFMFIDVSEYVFECATKYVMTKKEAAASYLASEVGVPFAKGLSADVLSGLGNENVIEYIEWDRVWDAYEPMGFKLFTRPGAGVGRVYIVHIK